MSSLFQSRKFWLAVVTAVVDVVLLSVGQFAPEWTDFTRQLTVIVSGLSAVVIGGIALEDAGAKASGTFPGQ